MSDKPAQLPDGVHYYRLRIPAISLLWLYFAGTSKRDAIDKAVLKINSKTIDYAPIKLWEVEEISADDFLYWGSKEMRP